MDNGLVFKNREQEEKFNNRLENQAIDSYLNDELQKAYNMNAQNIDQQTQMVNMNKTETDVIGMSRILKNMELDTYHIEEKDMKKAKLEARMGRKLSHLVLNDQKTLGDSEEMEGVKTQLGYLEDAMTTELKHAYTDHNIDVLLTRYEAAILACKNYCDTKNPWLPAGKRRKAKVQATLKRLMKEADAIEVAREIIKDNKSEAQNVKTGMDLLSLVAVQKVADKLSKKEKSDNYARTMENIRAEKEGHALDIESKKAEIERLREKYNEAKQKLEDKKGEKYNALKEKCDKLYEKLGWFAVTLGTSEEAKLYRAEKEKLEEEANLQVFQNEADNLEVKLENVTNEVHQLENQIKILDAREKTLERNEKERPRLEAQKEKEEFKRAKEKAKEDKINQISNKNDQGIKALPGAVQNIIKIITKGNAPTSYFKKKKSLTKTEKNTLNDIVKIRDAVSKFGSNAADAKSVWIAGELVRVQQDKFGNLSLRCNGEIVPFYYTAPQTVHMIEDDIISNYEVYGMDKVRNVINDTKTNLEDMTRGELLHSRECCINLIHSLTGLPKTVMNNTHVDKLKGYAQELLNAKSNKEEFKKTQQRIGRYLNDANFINKKENINTVLNQELQAVGHKEYEGIELKIEQKEDKSGWNEKERKIRDLVADILSSRETWVADAKVTKPGERLQSVIYNHADAIAYIISDQFRDKKANPNGIVEEILEKLPIFLFEESEEEKARRMAEHPDEEDVGGVDKLRKELGDALNDIRDFVNKQIDDIGKDEDLTEEEQKAVEQEKDLARLAVKAPLILETQIKQRIMKLDDDSLQELANVEQSIDECVEETMDGVQQAFDSCVEEIFKPDEEEELEEKKEEQKEEPKEIKNLENMNPPENPHVADHKKRISEYSTALSQIKTTIDHTYDQILKYQMVDKQLKEEMGKVNEEEKALFQEQIRANQVKIDNLKSEYDNYIENQKMTQSRLVESKKVLEKIAKQQRMDAIKKRIETRFKKEEDSVKRAEEAVKKSEEKIKIFSDKSNLKASINDRTKKYDNQKVLVDRLTDSLSDLQDKKKEAEDALETLNDRIRQLERQIEDAGKNTNPEDELTDDDKILLEKNPDDYVDDDEFFVKIIKEDLVKKKLDREENKKNIAANKAALEAEKNRVNDAKSKVNAAQDAVQKKQDEIEKERKKLDDLKADLDSYKDGAENADWLLEQETETLQKHKNVLRLANEELEKAKTDSRKDLSKIVTDSVKGGKKGQSLFMKNVFKTYFKGVPAIDKRSMLAGAIRNSNPIPKMTEEQRKHLSDDQKLELMSDMIGGMFKGAGPLFQKMLQGLPISSLPKGLRKAVEDTQDSLASIPDEIVKAHMDGIKERSHGKIDKIEVNKSLGAASVGQAFLCKIYGPDMKEGKNVVIKLLRPDARNRMMREKAVMLNAAKMTDEDGKLPFEIEEKRRKNEMGGMEATYTGNLQRIEEELDLTIEAKNCEEGQIYDKQVYDKESKKYKENLSDAMKLSTLSDPTSDTCMMEIAGTKTVKRYMSDMNERCEQLLWDFCEKEDEKDKNGKLTGKKILKRKEDGSFVFRILSDEENIRLEGVKSELESMLTDCEKRQQALAQLTEKWVTEGIFEKGYYHGDLHAGNIMISEKGVTVIDFGNATKLTSEEQKHIIRMMVAATTGDVERFRHGFHMLLKNTPEEVYQEKRDELTLLFTEIMNTGDETAAAERIAAALIRAQEIGLELPPTIANFSSCQMRLQNTLTDMNNNLKVLRNNVKNLQEHGAKNLSSALKGFSSAARIQSKNANESKEKAIENIDAELDKSVLKSKESVMETLQDKDKRDKFFGTYGIIVPENNTALEAELAKIDSWFKGEGQPTEEELDTFKKENDSLANIFPEIYKMREKTSDIKFLSNMYSQFYGVIRNLFFRWHDNKEKMIQAQGQYMPYLKAKSLDEYLTLWKNNREEYKNLKLVPDSTEIGKKARALIDAMDNKETSKEVLEQLQNEFYESFKAQEEPKVEEKKKDFIRHFKDLIPTLDYEKGEDGVEEELKRKGALQMIFLKNAISFCSNNKTNGDLIKQKGNELLEIFEKTIVSVEAYNENAPTVANLFDEFSVLMWEGNLNTLREMRENSKDKFEVENDDPKEFLEVMGGVMSDYKYDVLFSLDPVMTIKMLWKKITTKESE